MYWLIRNAINTILNITMAVVSFFLVLRILLELFGATRGTPFVNWIYGMSDSIMNPFVGIFPNFSFGSGSILNTVAVISFIAYAILSYLIMAIMDGIKRPDSTIRTRERTRII